ncbi:hypothetical protein AVEN_111081-1 [Araneus ventricosus]|uniref:Integrase catalytic domain-containing protein n=1 Tax=Araneus ventricosus TaxID=182803 RepID=A0A4Y2DQ54_ARAVE|nr:hypothetical protein AVEN_111081-1 [Araneus ventricosus]
MLLGAEIFYELLRPGQIYAQNSQLLLQNTVFGYVVSGSVDQVAEDRVHCGLILDDDLNKTLKQFWEIESVDVECTGNTEASLCEDHFVRTHKRNKDGRYVVSMALSRYPSCLGNSKDRAVRQLNSLWKRLSKDSEYLSLYTDFLREYEDLGHLERVVESSEPPTQYYIPHHGVLRPDKLTTKLRVVFNASSPTTTSISLNDTMKGDVIEDVFQTISRFRRHKFAFTIDIQKMYRQILINPDQQDLQRIVWKTGPNAEVSAYRLKTVTYGMSNAPFLAIRTLQQLAEDEKSRFPLASEVLLHDTYMDDIVRGAPDLETARRLQSQLRDALKSCGMTLHKWSSNSPELLNSSLSTDVEQSFSVDTDLSVKTLGISWRPFQDRFVFKVSISIKPSYTKREVPSVIARLYDPLGFLGPMLTRAKVLLQRLWQQRLDSDDVLPNPIADELKEFVTTMKCIEKVKTRFILTDTWLRIVLHGFADASESAYGAVVYLQCFYQNNSAEVTILASKSRVAPIRVISIPRLELCACVLLAQLVQNIRSSLRLEISNIVLHTDSTIALAWLKTPANHLKTFIANRVSKVQRLTENCCWTHAPSHLNPADLVSRGLSPRDLPELKLWWSGPSFLERGELSSAPGPPLMNESEYSCEFKTGVVPEMPISSVCVSTNSDLSFLSDLLCMSNSYVKILHIFSYVLRFVNVKKPNVIVSGPPCASELNQAENSFGVLRVGGRLGNSDLPCVSKYPAKPVVTSQLMGNLPRDRVVPDYPFNCSGVDFCGPFMIRYRNQRKGVLHKMYICIFVCFVSKAVHIEILSDLTSEAFIATLKRFFGRRGKCAKLYSDNGKTFVGANQEIKGLLKLVKEPDKKLSGFLSAEGIEWKFIPPRAPSFGGLWEAAVKSAKYHLKRIVGRSNLTYEEFLTVCIQIEGILNSRPLCPLSSSADDLNALTPAHFLIGRSMNSIIEPNLTELS